MERLFRRERAIFWGKNFAKAAGIQYQNRKGRNEYAWTTSWGVSTRLIGGMIATHADDDGMVMPLRLAPQHIVLLPVIRDEADRDALMGYVQEMADALRLMKVFDRLIEVVVDDRDLKMGEKGWSWVKKASQFVRRLVSGN